MEDPMLSGISETHWWGAVWRRCVSGIRVPAATRRHDEHIPCWCASNAASINLHFLPPALFPVFSAGRGLGRIVDVMGKRILAVGVVAAVIVAGVAGAVWVTTSGRQATGGESAVASESEVSVSSPSVVHSDVLEPSSQVSSSANPSSAVSPSSEESSSPEASVHQGLEVSISNVKVDSNSLTVWGVITDVVEDGGVCTATAVKGDETVHASDPGYSAGQSTSCGPVRIPLDELSEGTWGVTLQYESSSGSGQSELQTIEIGE